jgi:hypothetical protein
VIDKCQLTWGWLQQFVKEGIEFAGTQVLSMVHAHYPLIDFMHFMKGYPKEVMRAGSGRATRLVI